MSLPSTRDDREMDKFQENSNGDTAVRTVSETTIISGFVKVGFDYFSVAYPNATTEVYTFKTGGAGGTTVATVTIVYTSAAKNFISSGTYVEV